MPIRSFETVRSSIDDSRHNLLPIGSRLKTVLAVAGAAVVCAVAAAESSAQNVDVPLPDTGSPPCIWESFGGSSGLTNLGCNTPPAPESCTKKALNDGLNKRFHADPAKRRWAYDIARQGEVTAPGAGLTRQVDVSLQDDAAYLGDEGHTTAYPAMVQSRLIASTARVFFHPEDYMNKELTPEQKQRVRKTEKGINRLIECGYVIRGALMSGFENKRSRWRNTDDPNDKSPYDFSVYAAKVAARYKGRIAKWILGNEPNTKFGLIPFKGMSRHRTYRQLYDRAEKPVREIDGVNEVSVAGVASRPFPGKFLRGFFACLRPKSPAATTTDKNPKDCAPVKTDFVNVQPYKTRWRIRRVKAGPNKGQPIMPPLDRNVSPDAKEIAIDSLQTYKDLKHRLYEAGLLETPDGKESELGVSEFGIKISMPEDARSILMARTFENAIREGVGMYNYYGFKRVPAAWGGTFDTSIQPDDSFYTFSAAVDVNSEYIKLPAGPANP
jgi:hypothetical protein